MMTNEGELLTADERADVLNLLNKTFEDNNINLEVAMYEDDGSFFDVMFWKRNSSKPIMEGKNENIRRYL